MLALQSKKAAYAASLKKCFRDKRRRLIAHSSAAHGEARSRQKPQGYFDRLCGFINGIAGLAVIIALGLKQLERSGLICPGAALKGEQTVWMLFNEPDELA